MAVLSRFYLGVNDSCRRFRTTPGPVANVNSPGESNANPADTETLVCRVLCIAVLYSSRDHDNRPACYSQFRSVRAADGPLGIPSILEKDERTRRDGEEQRGREGEGTVGGPLSNPKSAFSPLTLRAAIDSRAHAAYTRENELARLDDGVMERSRILFPESR